MKFIQRFLTKKSTQPELLKIRIDLDAERSLDLIFTKEDPNDSDVLTLRCTEDFIYDMRQHLGARGVKSEIIEP